MISYRNVAKQIDLRYVYYDYFSLSIIRIHQCFCITFIDRHHSILVAQPLHFNKFNYTGAYVLTARGSIF